MGTLTVVASVGGSWIARLGGAREMDVGGFVPDRDGQRTGAELCASLVERLPITGLSISVLGKSGQSTIGASDPVAARIEQLQFELGEGPHWTASSTAAPVIVPDVHDADHSPWPVFGSAVQDTGAAALFAIPIIMGAVTVGVVDMYRATSGGLSPSVVTQALGLATLIAPAALRLAAHPGADGADDDHVVPGMRRDVHQATGMVLVQLNSSATEAFARLQAHAFAHGQSLEYVAREVVAGRLNFREDVR